MNPKIVSICFALAFVVGGCDSLNRGGELLARISEAPTVRGVEISFELENSTDGHVYFRSCCADVGFYVERLENGRWTRLVSQGLECPESGGVFIHCEAMPLSLAPGDSYHGHAGISQKGVYRLVFPYGGSYDGSDESVVVSNRIEIN